MLSNCRAGEDSSESLWLKGNQTSQSWRKSTLNIHWKNWYWSSNPLATWWEELTHWKDLDSGKDQRQEEKGVTEDEMIGWHRWLNEHEFEQAPGKMVKDREAWHAAVPGVAKSQTRQQKAAAAKSLQSCLTLYNPIDGSPPGSAVPGILQARTLEWVAISFSNAWKWKVKVKSLSLVRLLATPWTAAYQAPPPMGFSRQEYWSGVPLPSPQQKARSFQLPQRAFFKRNLKSKQ